MCMSAPKMPKQPEPPASPPPPTATAETLKSPMSSTETPTRKKGAAALTLRRPTVSAGSAGIGPNIPH